MSYHKFNESRREQTVLKRLKQGEIVALISDAGTPCISDPGMELVSFIVHSGLLYYFCYVFCTLL
jgi:16S rRNA (cytidine1402-2'-O)-methyltransferase